MGEEMLSIHAAINDYKKNFGSCIPARVVTIAFRLLEFSSICI